MSNPRYRGRETWHVNLFVLFVASGVASCVSSVAGQEPVKGFSGRLRPEPPVARKDRLSARVVLVKADWSEVEDAENARAELENLLSGSELPESYRANLLRSAPKIFFSSDFISLYDREAFAGFWLWLEERELVREAEVAVTGDPSPALPGVDQPSRHILSASVGEELLPLSYGGNLHEAPPFSKRTYVTTWQLVSHRRDSSKPETMRITASATPQVRHEWQTDDKQVDVRDLPGDSAIHFDFPVDKVVVLNMLQRLPEPEAAGIRLRGWEPVWVLVPETPPLQLIGKPKPAKPSSFVRTSFVSSRNDQNSPGDRKNSHQEPQPTIRVFSLRLVQAASAAKTLMQLVPDGTFAVDERTNSIIASCGDETLKMVEALLMRLDTPPVDMSTKPAWAEEEEAKESLYQLNGAAAELRKQYSAQEATAEQFTWSLADKLDSDAEEEARARLSQIVREAFRLRQQLQETELKLLRERIRAIEKKIEQRALLQDAIIRQRVDQLLTRTDDANPPAKPKQPAAETAPRTNQPLLTLSFDHTEWGAALKWLAETTNTTLTIRSLPPGTVTYRDSQMLTPQQAWGVLSTLMPGGWAVYDRDGHKSVESHPQGTPKPQFATAAVAPLRAPEALRQAAVAARAALAEARRQAGASPTEPSAVKEARQQLELLRDEYAAQLDILTARVASDEAALQLAESELKRTKDLQKRGLTSSAAGDAALLKSKRATAEYVQSTTLLELHRKVAETSGLLADDKAEGGPAKDPQNAVVWIETLVRGLAGEPKLIAGYSNGAILSSDGLIGVAFRKSVQEAVERALDSDDAEQLAISVFFSDKQRFDAKVVAFDKPSGMALLKIDASGLQYLTCAATAGLGQKLRYYSSGGLGQHPIAYETEVIATPGPSDDVPTGRFLIDGGRVGGQAGVVVANDGRVVGFSVGEFRQRAKEGALHHLCPGAAPLQKMLAGYSASPEKNANGVRGAVQIEALPDLNTIILRGPAGAVKDVAKVLSDLHAQEQEEQKQESPKQLGEKQGELKEGELKQDKAKKDGELPRQP